jgi:hypothetical protein
LAREQATKELIMAYATGSRKKGDNTHGKLPRPPPNKATTGFAKRGMQTFLKFLKDNGTLVALVALMIIFSFLG